MLRQCGIFRKHRRHGIADISHFLHGDDGLILVSRAVFVGELLDIVAGKRR